ncbi:Uu.00g135640.m01.CDS01 [Anthostomella pinea]|uniref:Uu.00g135640.m01.CDS01 n=1 Tax=Anthostomella pinea TaxID=933095 RepID=A0AAI8YKY6_9PEZI|nr:Uu.00g135640.m01.CDS01 [Anthostomella pinea]
MEEPPIITPGTSISSPKVIFLMADYGHDPTGSRPPTTHHLHLGSTDVYWCLTAYHIETAVPYTAFKKANYQIHFATENGKAPRCDKKMLEGVTQKLLGATKDVVAMYKKMQRSDGWLHPLSWTSPDFSLDPYDLVVLPGGHDKGVRQIIDSETVHQLMVDYFPKTKKPGVKSVAAVCHGVMVLAESKDATGRSVLRDCVTTALPAKFEQLAYWGTRAFLGDYYKTYGHGSENVEESVTKVLGNPAQWKTSMNLGAFVVEDEQHNYISARYPGDVEMLAEESIKLLESFNRIV